ncbi:ABC transporter ATP-binding protein [uncultured Ruegeria sp.]|uniref:ABC transporter ATP-binding protein n=1 Tax=uncultured Ruegeria sp. TaxID=259304 RepID=UPI00261B7FFD|nr:ABC transporter ATP-binding protein [uncultured Ruegeria sp.]
MNAVLTVEGLSKSFGSLKVTRDVTLELHTGECHALIGPNGAGKTTLINLITGILPAESGRITLNGRDLSDLPMHQRAGAGLGRTFQITSIFPDFSALENVALAAQSSDGRGMGFWRIAASDSGLNAKAADALDMIGLGARKDARGADMSHGEHRLLELAMAVVTNPDALLLDEPMAGLGRAESEELVDTLQSLKAQVPLLMVEHDMEAVFSMADRISVLESGQIVAAGTPEQVRSDPQARAAYLGEEAV